MAQDTVGAPCQKHNGTGRAQGVTSGCCPICRRELLEGERWCGCLYRAFESRWVSGREAWHCKRCGARVDGGHFDRLGCCLFCGNPAPDTRDSAPAREQSGKAA